MRDLRAALAAFDLDTGLLTADQVALGAIAWIMAVALVLTLSIGVFVWFANPIALIAAAVIAWRFVSWCDDLAFCVHAYRVTRT